MTDIRLMLGSSAGLVHLSARSSKCMLWSRDLLYVLNTLFFKLGITYEDLKLLTRVSGGVIVFGLFFSDIHSIYMLMPFATFRQDRILSKMVGAL